MNQTKSILISILSAILIIIGLVYISNSFSGSGDDTSTNADSRSGGVLTFEKTAFDFGTISMAAGKVLHTYKIKNVSAQPVIISKIYTSCMCTTASIIKGSEKKGPFGMPGHMAIPTINEEVKPGEEVSVEGIFDPAAHGPAGVGPIERTITLENNAGKAIELTFTAMVKP